MAVKRLFSRLALLIAALIFFALPASAPSASAHDIPNDVTVQAFVKPEGHTLRVLMRLPLKSIQDIEFARKERDFVDLTKVDTPLRDAANLALVNNMEVYEGSTLLPRPTIAGARMSLES